MSDRGVTGGALLAGAAKVDVTGTAGDPANDPLYARALVLRSGATTVAIVAVDAVAIGEIGPIPNDYLGNVRARLRQELGIEPEHVLIGASHCHGIVCGDVEQRTVQAVREAWQAMVPVRVGAGVGHEDRIQENRRYRLKDGREADARRAYSLPADDEVVGVGPIDPQIGILKLEREDGSVVAALYNFACHPIEGVPGGANTADLTGFASRAIERALPGAVALFLQGCGADVNPTLYKGTDAPRNAEALGDLLGLSTLQALLPLPCRDGAALKLVSEVVALPAADPLDLERRMSALREEQARLLRSLQGTNLNLKTYLSLVARHGLAPEFASAYSYRYLHEQSVLGRDDLRRHDEQNRQEIAQYTRNVLAMEELTRLQTNLDLLEKHRAWVVASGSPTIDVEVAGLRVGDFVLLTFPGELAVQIGLNLKAASPHALTFVAADANGYIYYSPTTEQLHNPGAAQEDCDCRLAPKWQAAFERAAVGILSRL